MDEVQPAHARASLLDLTQRQNRPGYMHKTQRKGTLACATVRSYYRSLSRFFSWSDAEGLLNGCKPMANVEAPKVHEKEIRVLTEDEVARLLALVTGPCQQCEPYTWPFP